MGGFLLFLLLGGLAAAQPRSDFEAQKAYARNLISQNQAKLALSILQPLAKHAPDDYELIYDLARACRLTRAFAQAEIHTQWLLDLRPTYPGGLWEAGLLREHFGDFPGAVEILSQAYRALPANQIDERLQLLEDLARNFDKLNQKPQAARLRQEIHNQRKAHENSDAHRAQPKPERP